MSQPIGHHLRCVTEEFAPTPSSVPATRGFVGRFFRDAGASTDTIDTAQLCVSEAATNAIRHTGLDYTVTCTALDDGRIAVEVRDQDPRSSPLRRHPADDDENGRGLELLDALAEWHVTTTATGKTLAFVLKEDR
ncbi:ATP-binding protein [Yinghuangia sp. ASG 101]|uniref:ATP-binding protein n=1 Tax=Yinghuangia sp. ASG 101 TaxID=2896848 RepID=UPI001E3BDADC|nr:ATP-binding protein [Yinghuangia sp. ASG 101]UGQ12370.1 ATP-binding protein [Yinghuangia sp. ASG 101]